jgi:hypothetical protein
MPWNGMDLIFCKLSELHVSGISRNRPRFSHQESKTNDIHFNSTQFDVQLHFGRQHPANKHNFQFVMEACLIRDDQKCLVEELLSERPELHMCALRNENPANEATIEDRECPGDTTYLRFAMEQGKDLSEV